MTPPPARPSWRRPRPRRKSCARRPWWPGPGGRRQRGASPARNAGEQCPRPAASHRDGPRQPQRGEQVDQELIRALETGPAAARPGLMNAAARRGRRTPSPCCSLWPECRRRHRQRRVSRLGPAGRAFSAARALLEHLLNLKSPRGSWATPRVRQSRCWNVIRTSTRRSLP
jgi:hypothetical protein